MNRETIVPSELRHAGRRRPVDAGGGTIIIAAVVVVAAIVGRLPDVRGGGEEARPRRRAQAGRRTGPDRHGGRARPAVGRADGHRHRNARRARVDMPVGVAGEGGMVARCWSSRASGSAPARCSRSSIARCRPAGRSSWRRRSRSPAPTPRSPRTNRARAVAGRPRLRLQGRPRPQAGDARRRLCPRAGRPGEPRRNRARGSAGSTSVAPAAGLVLERNVEPGQVVGPARRLCSASPRRRNGAARAA